MADSVAPRGSHEGGTRRGFLYLATGGVAAFGVAALVWPLIDQMNPSADVLALSSTEMDVAKVEVGQRIKVMWRGHPVFVAHRTPAQYQTVMVPRTVMVAPEGVQYEEVPAQYATRERVEMVAPARAYYVPVRPRCGNCGY